jgi:uncharacterized protein YdcH (DUF465 family)
MQGHHHAIGEEFPEFKDRIHALKAANAHFKRLSDHPEEVDKKIARAESRIELMSEEEEAQFRKSTLALKDEIYAMLVEKKRSYLRVARLTLNSGKHREKAAVRLSDHQSAGAFSLTAAHSHHKSGDTSSAETYARPPKDNHRDDA